MPRVLVTEDSVVARKLLVGILDADPALEVVGEASNGREAVRLAAELSPDVITMDVHMPVMNGVDATRRIMEETPTPIVMVSAVDTQDVASSFGAMEAGAVSVLAKPKGPASPDFASVSAELTSTVRTMAGVRVVRRRPSLQRAEERPVAAPARAVAPAMGGRAANSERIDIVAIGASTGGPDALGAVLGGLPAALPVPVVITQHITKGFHAGLAGWLDGVCPLPVRLAEQGAPLRAGEVLIAPGEGHLSISRGRTVAIADEPPVSGHKPSVTRMFESVAGVYGRHALGVILTGMGDDGADGLLRLREAGGWAIGQDEASSVVYGMPREAYERGAVHQQVALSEVAAAIVSAAAKRRPLSTEH